MGTVGDLQASTVPFRRVMRNAESALQEWRVLIAVSSLRPYWTGMTVRVDLDAPSVQELQEYINACSELAQEDALWDNHSVNHKFGGPAGVKSHIKVPSERELRSIAVSFRRIYSTQEKSATMFSAAQSSLQKNLRRQLPESEMKILQEFFLGPLQGHIGALFNHNIDTLAHRKLYPDSPFHDKGTGYLPRKPSELISVFFYGGLIHRGEKKVDLDHMRGDPEAYQIAKFNLVKALRAFSIAYLAYAELILILGRGNGLVRPLVRDMHESEFRFE